MKYAKFVKMGGELIEASCADYKDYYGVIVCPHCGEPVFLRKEHERQTPKSGKPVTVKVQASFVHHKAVPEVSVCEMRVGNYSPEYVMQVAGKARNQRIRVLELSMWKYIKTNLSLDFGDYAAAIKDLQVHSYERKLVNLAKDIIEKPITPEVLAELVDALALDSFKEALDPIRTTPDDEKALNNFLSLRKKDWTFHRKIAQEALSVFSQSALLKKVRERFLACICNRSMLQQANPKFFRLDNIRVGSDLWLEEVARYILTTVTVVFLTVDWISVFDATEKQENRQSRGFATKNRSC